LKVTEIRSAELPLFDRPYRPCHFLLLICSKNDSVLRRFQDTATFTVYVTARDVDVDVEVLASTGLCLYASIIYYKLH